MNNIQKHFKRKADCGLRRFATGGIPGFAGMSDGENELLKSANDRLMTLNAQPTATQPTATQPTATQPTATQPTADPFKGMSRLQAAQYTNDPDVLNKAFDNDQKVSAAVANVKRSGLTTSQRAAYGAQLGLLASKGLTDSAEMEKEMLAPGTRTQRLAFGAAMNKGVGLELGFQAGGTVDPVEALLAKTKAQYGGVPAPQTQAPQPVPTPAPQPAPQPQAKQGMFAGLKAALDPERRMKAAGFAQGGKVGVDPAGFIHGPKGVDKVPARVAETGEPIRVGAGERIVNKQQNAALEQLAQAQGVSLDEYLEGATGEPVGPTMKKGLRGMNTGGFVDDFGNLKRPQGFQAGDRAVVLNQQLAAAAPEAQLAPTGQTLRRGAAFNDTSAFDNEVRQRAAAQRAKEAAAIAQPTPTPAPQPAQPPAKQGMIKSALSVARPYANAAMVGSTMVNNAVTAHESDDPSAQLAEGLKAGLMMHPVTRPAGWALQVADPVAKAATGYGLAEGIDKLASFHPDYMRNRVDAQGKSLSSVKADGQKIAAVQAADPRAAHEAILNDPNQGRGKIPGLATPEQKAAIMKKNAVNEARAYNADAPVGVYAKTLAWMKAQGVDTSKQNEYEGKLAKDEQGLRTLRAGGDNIYVGRDKKGQLTIASGLDKTDAQLEAGRAKEADRMTKDLHRQVAYFERANAERDAFDPSITDPAVRASGLRRVMLNEQRGTAAAKGAHDNLDLQLRVADHNLKAQGQQNMQSNSDRDAKQKNFDNNVKDMDSWLETMAPTAGLKDADLASAQRKRAVLQQALRNHWGGNVPTDRETYMKESPRMAREAAATSRLYDVLSQQGLIDKWWSNGGKNPAMTLQALRPKSYDDKTDELMLHDGYRLKGKDVWGQDADMAEVLRGRIK